MLLLYREFMDLLFLPCFIHNSEEGGCTVKIYPPLYTPKSKDREKDFYDVTQELVVIFGARDHQSSGDVVLGT